MKRNMRKIVLPTRVGSLLLSVFGDFDNIVRLSRKSMEWVVDTNYITQLGKMGVSKLMEYRCVGPVTVQETAEVCRKHG